MSKLLLTIVLLIGLRNASDPEEIIKGKLQKQVECWNKGDITCYMKAAYWQSDSLKFVGATGITYGFERTLQRYKVGYPSQKEMGTLSFEIKSVEMIGMDACFVIGHYLIDGKQKDSGHFSQLWKKIDEDWVIIADHSSN